MEEQLQQQIEAYLANQLSLKEKTAFEAKMAADETLAADVKLYQQMDDLLGETDVMDFSATLTEVMTTPTTAESTPEAIIKSMPTKSSITRRWLSLAAGFALVAVLGTVIYTNLAQPSANDLYSANMEFPASLGGGGTLRSTDEQTLDPSKLGQITRSWQQANEAYQQEQYDLALQNLVTIENIDPNFETENRGDYFFKKGLVQLKTGQIKAAIISFEAVNTGSYVSNAEWKRALALLKVDTNKAKTALETIVNKNHPEQAAAIKILESL